jgi:hypothetical protein
MKNTRDHIEIPEMKEVLSFKDEGVPVKHLRCWGPATLQRSGTGLSTHSSCGSCEVVAKGSESEWASASSEMLIYVWVEREPLSWGRSTSEVKDACGNSLLEIVEQQLTTISISRRSPLKKETAENILCIHFQAEPRPTFIGSYYDTPQDELCSQVESYFEVPQYSSPSRCGRSATPTAIQSRYATPQID